jgi:DNA (cytosine-5)-methyltransferase 3A
MNVLSLFDGMSCGRIALGRADIKVDNYYSSEIKDYAIEVASNNYPQDNKNRLGDITTINGSDLPTIDLLIGGSPCQDFSGANKNRLGVEGSKSRLFYEYLRLKNETKPKYFLLENVKMGEDHQNIISKELGCEPIKINSVDFSPQNRNRLYWTNIPLVTPKHYNIGLNDILEYGWWNDKYKRKERGRPEKNKARCLLESDSRPSTRPIKMFHRYFTTGFTTLIFKSEKHYLDCANHYIENFKGLKARPENGQKYGEIDQKILDFNIDLSVYEGVRYLTPQEREDCQTVPRGYTKGLTNNQVACILGDGWTIDVIAHIFRGLK